MAWHGLAQHCLCNNTILYVGKSEEKRELLPVVLDGIRSMKRESKKEEAVEIQKIFTSK